MPQRKTLLARLRERRQRVRLQMQIPERFRKIPPEVEEAARELLSLKRQAKT